MTQKQIDETLGRYLRAYDAGEITKLEFDGLVEALRNESRINFKSAGATRRR